MKTLLCYGDSNTWGWNPATQERYDRSTRWPGVLRNTLGQGYVVLEEGLNGRTTVWDDPLGNGRNGKTYLLPCLETHRPLDLVLLMLGTNDLKARFALPACDIAKGVEMLGKMIQQSDAGYDGQPPRLLLLAPPPVLEVGEFAESFQGATAKSQQLGRYYQQVAAELGCDCFDTAEVIVSSEIDGIHLEADAHRKLGERVASLVTNLDI
ncbi:hypothetical protein GF339_16980 [candidate division KSB3 bacterium]|uniref:SGNH hydrolase-type esterase domain-containing protein n=1 Tax=candidate division KSB3 bacterium TaxID=2044937 RepID=A0A9D5JXT7_9BACT|nr:hypothetical protein [candidate division KSB3 bacterium]MBD3326282.1 hypothetical protein [candidate division KSB3 bacterium]